MSGMRRAPVSDTPTELDAETIAAINDAEPDFMVAEDGRALIWFEIATAALTSLGQRDPMQTAILASWPGSVFDEDGDFVVPEYQRRTDILNPMMAHTAEALIALLKTFLRDHDIPFLATIAQTSAGIVSFKFMAAP